MSVLEKVVVLHHTFPIVTTFTILYIILILDLGLIFGPFRQHFSLHTVPHTPLAMLFLVPGPCMTHQSIVHDSSAHVRHIDNMRIGACNPMTSRVRDCAVTVL